MAARLLIFSTNHFACWLTTLCLASGAIFAWAEMLWANYFARGLATFHLAAIGIETLAAC
jgi:hypothetical protein